MRRYAKLAAAFTVAAAALMASGCRQKVGPDPSFTTSNTIMLNIDGKDMMVYDPATCQLAFNAGLREFRVMNDNMSEFFYLTCDELPTAVGQTIRCDLKYLGPNTKSAYNCKGADFSVELIGDEGTIWLWCGKKKIAVRVRIIT